MLKRLIILSSLLFVFAAGANIVFAQRGWENLGTKEVKDQSEQDTWRLGKDKGTFRSIKLVVISRPVRFYRLRVTYENGGTQEFQIAKLIKAGGETRALDLSGRDRYIDKVDVWYEAHTAGHGVRSSVSLLGRR
jgi:hypothetical protein